MTTKPTETPRTDAQSCEALYHNDTTENTVGSYEAVRADFARQLERELSEVKKELAWLKLNDTALGQSRDAARAERDQLQKQNAALEKDKERLDWQESNLVFLNSESRHISRSFTWKLGTEVNIRQAIDQARHAL